MNSQKKKNVTESIMWVKKFNMWNYSIQFKEQLLPLYLFTPRSTMSLLLPNNSTSFSSLQNSYSKKLSIPNQWSGTLFTQGGFFDMDLLRLIGCNISYQSMILQSMLQDTSDKTLISAIPQLVSNKLLVNISILSCWQRRKGQKW